MKCKLAGCFLLAAVWGCLATGQSSKPYSTTSSSTKTGPDPMKNATKPLTEKSAMPSQHHTPADTTPPKSSGTANTKAELTKLERHPVATTSPKSSTANSSKNSGGSKPADHSDANGSGINFKYQKPAGGLEASNPNARSANSTTPRVTKKN
jgi:hypothetical protein